MGLRCGGGTTCAALLAPAARTARTATMHGKFSALLVWLRWRSIQLLHAQHRRPVWLLSEDGQALRAVSTPPSWRRTLH